MAPIARAVFRRQPRGSGYQPPAGDHTERVSNPWPWPSPPMAGGGCAGATPRLAGVHAACAGPRGGAQRQ